MVRFAAHGERGLLNMKTTKLNGDARLVLPTELRDRLKRACQKHGLKIEFVTRAIVSRAIAELADGTFTAETKL